MRNIINNFFKRMMYIYRKEGQSTSFNRASAYITMLIFTFVLLIFATPYLLFFDNQQSNDDYIVRKGKYALIIIPLFFLLDYFVQKRFRVFQKSNIDDFQKVWTKLNLFSFWVLYFSFTFGYVIIFRQIRFFFR